MLFIILPSSYRHYHRSHNHLSHLMKVAILSLNWREENFQNFLVFFLGSKYLLTLSVKDQIFQFFLRFVPSELILNCVDVSGMASIRKDTRLRFFFFKNVSACLNCHFMQASVRWWLIFALSYSSTQKSVKIMAKTCTQVAR